MAKVVELEPTKFTYEGILNKEPSVLIDWFDDLGTNNDYCWLSNFYQAPIKWLGFDFHSTEHAYQATKYFGVDDDWFHTIRITKDPNDAKALGRTGKSIRQDWEAVKYRVMKDLVFTKFSTHPELAEQLTETEDAYLQEGTFWYDEVWGVNLLGTQPDGSTYIIQDPLERQGQNWLGTILMETRARLNLENLMEWQMADSEWYSRTEG